MSEMKVTPVMLEGTTLRKHMITASGRIRDTVYYGILDRSGRR